MSKSQLQQAIRAYRAHLLAHEKAATHALQHAHAHTLATIAPRLAHLYRQIADKQQADEDVPLHWLYEESRLHAIKQLITNQVNHFGALAQVTTNHLQRAGVQLGSQAAQAQLRAMVPVGVHFAFGVPHPGAIANMVGATQSGSPLADLFAGFGEEAADKAGKALITGITLGGNPREIARDVQQALDISRQRALTIARTEALRVYRDTQSENFRANSDVVSGWVWIADQSANTCAACIFMNGSEHSLDEDMDSHVNCRCVMGPLTRSWSDILSPLGIDTSDIEDTSIDIEDGSDWFDQQDEQTQRAILGSDARYQLYQDGMPLSEMVGVKRDAQWGNSVYVKPLKELVK